MTGKLLQRFLISLFVVVIAAYLLIWLFSPLLVRHLGNQALRAFNLSLSQDSSVRYNPFLSRLSIDALSLYQQLVKSKASGDVTKLAKDIGTQARIASARNTIAEMTSVLFGNFDAMLSALREDREIELESRILYRYQASLVIDKCINRVDELFSSAGGSSVFLGSEIQQRFLDIHTARAHVANNPTAFARNLGAVSLGADNTDYFV